MTLWARMGAAVAVAAMVLAAPSAAEAQTRGVNASPGKGLPDKDGYIHYGDAFAMTLVDDALVRCADAGPGRSNGIGAIGPTDADGWVKYIDILRCDNRKRVLRVEEPDLRVKEDHNWATHGVGAWNAIATGSGIIFFKRDGGWEMYDRKLKPVKIDPEKTLMVRKDLVVQITDTPGVFVPYLADASLPKLPDGMIGFQILRADNTYSETQHSETVEVWRTPQGLKYGQCAKDYHGDVFYRAPYCGAIYDEVKLGETTFDGEIFNKTSAKILYGRKGDTWEVARSLRLGVALSEWEKANLETLILPTPEADRAGLKAASAEEVAVKSQALFGAYMKLADDKVERRVYPTMAEVIERYRAFEADQARMRAAQEAEQRANQQRQIEQAKANDPAYCYRTDACKLGPVVRWNMAQGARDFTASARIATESRWSSLIADDILAARSRGDRNIWDEQTIYQYASADPRLKDLLGQTWKEVQLVEGNRQLNRMNRDMEMNRAIARNAPLTLPQSQPGWQPLSSLEQDYYVGRGYVKVPSTR